MYNYYQQVYPMMPMYSQPMMYPSPPFQVEKTNIPYLPILGQQSMPKLIQNIHKSIVDEASAAKFYQELLQLAPNELHRDFIEHTIEDELSHEKAFSKLYKHFTGKNAQYQIEPIKFGNYKEGLLIALKGELEAVEFYRNVQLSNIDPLVRDTFYYAMIDELEHATMFGVMYNSL